MIIDPSIYDSIAIAYADALEDGTSFIVELYVMGTVLQPLENSGLIVNNIILAQNALAGRQEQASTSMVAAIAALQSNLVKYAGSVDAYLQENSLTVRQSFASASELAGYPISNAFIDG